MCQLELHEWRIILDRILIPLLGNQHGNQRGHHYVGEALAQTQERPVVKESVTLSTSKREKNMYAEMKNYLAKPI